MPILRGRMLTRKLKKNEKKRAGEGGPGEIAAL
jgi:hypothetical protein